MLGEKPIEVVNFHNEERLSVPERKARFEKEGIGMIAELEEVLRTVGKAEFDSSDNRRMLRKKMEAKQADLVARGKRALTELSVKLSRLLGEVILLPSNDEKAAQPVSFMTSLDLHHFEAKVARAEVLVAKLEAFEKNNSSYQCTTFRYF